MSEKKKIKKRDAEKEFRRIKHEKDKQIRQRMQAESEVVYVDTSRNISVNLGEEDLKEDMEEQGICTETEEPGGSTSTILHKEAIHHLKKKNMEQATNCVEKAQDMLESVDYSILTTQAELELQKGNYRVALKTSGIVLSEEKRNRKATFVKAVALFNLCNFEHALVLYHKAARMSPDSLVFRHGIIQCTAAITRVLDTPGCFEDASETISVNSVIKYLKKPAVPKGTAKLVALDKFKKLMDPKPKTSKYENIDVILKMEKKKTKKKDPLDQDKDFLKGLVKELDPITSNIRMYVIFSLENQARAAPMSNSQTFRGLK